VIVASGPRRFEILHYVGRAFWLLLGWDVVIAALYGPLGQRWVAVDNLPMPLIGSALAIVISLRNNAAYARWWEARQLWGGVVNNSRTLARQTRLYLPGHPAQAAITDLAAAYAHALRCHLRRQEPWEAIARLVPAPTLAWLRTQSNVPDALLAAIADQLATLLRSHALDSIQTAALADTLAQLGNMQGGAECIKNTPMPRQYNIFPRLFAQVFCVLLPLAMVPELGLATPLGSTVVGFIFLALDRAGRDLEDPFENTVYDVPLTSISRTVEINLNSLLGGRTGPEPVVPVDGVLW
jgi:putative membrane protein